MAQERDVLFAREWGDVVSAEANVPRHLAPVDSVPTINDRVLDVAPYIDHDPQAGDDVSVKGWVEVGRMVGRMHRLGSSVIDRAAVALPYGNHPHDALLFGYFDRMKARTQSEHLSVIARSERILDLVRSGLRNIQDALPRGVVHGDLHFWNVLYREDDPVAIIDLDFLQRGVLLHDLAYPFIWLSAWEKDRGGAWANVGERFLAAYEEGRGFGLTKEEQLAFPYLRVWINLFFFLFKVHTSWDGLEDAVGDLELAEAKSVELGLGVSGNLH